MRSTTGTCTNEDTRNPTWKSLTEQHMKKDSRRFFSRTGLPQRPYKVVQLYQGGGSDTEDRRTPECMQHVQWRRDHLTSRTVVIVVFRDMVIFCRGNRPCTSYSRTNGYGKLRTNGYDIAYTFTHNNITLEHNAMNNKNTIAHMHVHNTQY